MKIFVISLDGATQRRRSMEGQLKTLHLKFEFFSAISHGPKFKSHPDLPYSNLRAQKILKRPLSTNELGCALSHLSIYRKILREEIAEALILEDDANCKEGLPATLLHLSEAQNWEMALLGHWSLNRDSMSLGAELSFFGREPFLDGTMGNAAEFPLGAYAYAIKKSAAAKLLEYFCPVRMPADYVTGGAEIAGVNLKLISPPVVTHLPGESTIGKRQVWDEPLVEFSFGKEIKHLIRKLLLFMRKVGLFRKSYVWVFNRQFR